MWAEIEQILSVTGWKIAEVMGIITVGVIGISLLGKIVTKWLRKSPLDNTFIGFVVSLTKFVLWLLLATIVAASLNIPITSLVAVLGALGLAAGLALQGSLSNLANGIVIILTKPFKEGDFVEIAGISGTVKNIKMLTTEIITTDNKKITIPNSSVTTESVINFSDRPTRRVDLTFSASYQSDTALVKQVLTKIVENDSRIMSLPAPVIRMGKMEESSLSFIVRCWVSTKDYWDVYWELNETVFDAFKANNINIPFRQLDIRMCSSVDKS